MRVLVAAALLAASTLSLAQSPQAPAKVDALMALARVHGVVRYFHPSDSLDQVKWDAFLVHAAGTLNTPKELERLYAPIVEGFRVVPEGTPAIAPQGDGPRVEWRHLGYGMEPDANSPYVSWRTHHDPLHNGKVKGPYFQHRAGAEASVHADPVMRVALGGGLEAHVPVSLPISAVKVGEGRKSRLDALAKELAAVPPPGESVSRAHAHADGIAAWNVARHFYPYWSVVKIDWDAVLRQWLAEQPATQTREQLRDRLRALTAPLGDGHVNVFDPKSKVVRAFLPISVRPVGEQFAVDASQDGRVRAGDVIASVDGAAASKWFADRMELISGSPQHKRWRAALELMAGARDANVELTLLRGRETLRHTLAYASPRPMQGPRPAPIAEVKPGVRYVDVTRFDKAAFDAAMEAMKGAKAIVFDLRGYPARDAVSLVSLWIPRPDPAQWMFVPRYDKPFAQSTAAWSIGWQASRNPALEKPAKVLIADGRTISYAESLAAYFPDLAVGPVVGERTAGANGNVARATLPSGMAFFFTSMRVTRHDGTTLLHLVGIAPDEPASPTLEGLRAGRDELLERAIAVAEQRAAR